MSSINEENKEVQAVDSECTEQQNVQKEKLAQELIEMGFPEADVLKIIESAGCCVPKDVIVEQLLTNPTKPLSDDCIPLVEDDGDQLWEDVNIPYKMVIVINMGLKMGIGKIASQAAHAALGLYEVVKGRKSLKNDFHIWDDQGSRKIVLEAKDTADLIRICTAGKLHNIPCFCVQDAGLTEIAPNSFTALALFGSDDQLKPVTGKLRLLK
ncbi:probable peptidyl-tRNA hydrolase 2 [Adelges cooleyi]|uniref:probable peptidyl-tRNA hydrolase 2 n=1 Tax=Adelges cooleyi TaxID=133065 RepID=UPI00217F2E04|nr:probable peptidyl-tRNA hydrolase 2 [Adelges cooleyi]